MKALRAIFFTCFAILLGYLLLCFIVNSTIVAQPNQHPVVIAHRGASGTAPENTLAAFEKGVAFGAHQIELDVHLSKDGEVIVIHDATVDRTTNGTGKVEELTLAELKKLDAGSWKDPAFANEKLPTLDEALKQVNGRAKVLIEFKHGDKLYEGIEQKVIDIVRQNQAESWIVYQSFHPKVIDKLTTLQTQVPVYLLIVGRMPLLPFYYDDAIRFGSPFSRWKGKVKGINPNERFATSAFINKAHKNGFEVFVWTVNKTEDMDKLKARGVDGLITNYPEKLTSHE